MSGIKTQPDHVGICPAYQNLEMLCAQGCRRHTAVLPKSSARVKVGRTAPARRKRRSKPARFGHLQTLAARWDSAPWSSDILPTETEANPEGWQMVAGGRSARGGNDHRKACPRLGHPGGVPDRTPTCYHSGTLARVQDIFYAVTRRSPPTEPPPATSGYRLATLWVDRSRMSKLQAVWATRPHIGGLR